MALADRLATPPAVRRGQQCSVGALLDSLDGDDLAAVQAALANPAWTEAMIWQVLTDEGYDVAKQSIGRHRRGHCSCARDRR